MDIRDPYRLGIPQGQNPRVRMTRFVGQSPFLQMLNLAPVSKKTMIETGFDPIPQSAAAQYMIAQEKARRALAESTRMQQGQIPQMKMPAPKRPQDVLADQARRQQSQLRLPEQEEGFLQKLYADPSSARGKALQAAAATALQLSGYQDKPITTGEVLGAMMQSGMGAYEKQSAIESKRELAAEERAYERSQRAIDLKIELAKLEAQRAAAGIKSDREIVKLRRDLRKDFKDDSKLYKESKQFYTDVVNNSKETQSAAADLALVFSFMKMLDPESVVREGEQMQVRSLGGLSAEVRSLLSRMGLQQEGTVDEGVLVLDPSVRATIRDIAAQKFADLSADQLVLEAFTSAEGARAGLDDDFFSRETTGDGSQKRPYIAATEADLPDDVKVGDYVVVGRNFFRIAGEK